ncbi:DUF6768 family protein [Pseudoalteromonas denitrificans]|uniref:Uncharacterized protein n=1 Tax=Pseudoalteromonas denitrificans DSM 6059 TaxID=1123010 RepID=A0A1I1DYG1_9GAMM|nr:DUF6768 family protein [Pseudoalteromonas denitrificans]SFB79847.1 hypothetical protein SAMN02745724_00119 [Pseudoalteromonas denitrificans DSM 6059]
MTIDSKIKKELENDAAEIDKILAQENGGLTSMLASGFKGSMRRWFVLINIVTVIISAALLWCAYQFFTVDSELQTFWGILLIVCLQLQVATKQWLFNEMSRSSLIREIKRVELAVSELEEKQNYKTD